MASGNPPAEEKPRNNALATGTTKPTLQSRVAIIASGQSDPEGPRATMTSQLLSLVRAGDGTVANDPTGLPIPKQLADVERVSADLLVAIGGDGTINAAVDIAVSKQRPLLIIPMGTMNLIAKDLGIPIEPQSIVNEASSLECVHIDVASVNERYFVHSALLGMVPDLSEVREEIRDAPDLGDRLRHVPDFLSKAFAPAKLDLDLDSERGSVHCETYSVAVTNNPLQEPEFIGHRRATLTGACLGVYASAHKGLFAPAKLLATLSTGRFLEDPESLQACCKALRIRSDAPTLAVSLDGEVVDLPSPLTFKSHPGALPLALPAPFIRG